MIVSGHHDGARAAGLALVEERDEALQELGGHRVGLPRRESNERHFFDAFHLHGQDFTIIDAMRVLFVVPAFNEEEALPAVVRDLLALRVPGTVDSAVLVVDDGSSDRTAEVAAAAGARVLRMCKNLGIGGAVQAGLRVALREGFDVAVQVDGDGQHPPAEIPRLLAAFAPGSPGAKPDLVVGARFQTAGFHSTALRRLGSWWLGKVLRALGVRTTDPTSGFRAYGRRALALFDRVYPYDYPEPEALAIAARAGLDTVEVPVTMRERQGGASSIGAVAAPYYMIKVTLALVLTSLRTRRTARGESR